MDPHDYPAAHFRAMADLASQLTGLPAEVLEHEYSCSHFGSWWLTVRRNGISYRIVFDGKERQVTFEREAPGGPAGTWSAIATWAASSGDQPQLIREIVARLRAARDPDILI
jgi:hypothetical protein